MSRRIPLVPLAFIAAAPSALALAQLPTQTLARRTGSAAEPFSNVVAVQELPDRRVVVTDSRERTVMLVSFDDGSVRQLGRNGNGPNEYTMASHLFRGRADTLLLMDFRARRMLRIAPSGTLAGTLPVEISPGDTVPGETPRRGRIVTSPRFVDADGRLYYEVSYIETGKGVQPEAFVARWDPRTRTSRRVAPLRAWYPEHSSRWRAPFLYQDVYAVAADGRVARVVPADYHVEWYRDDALVARGPRVSYDPVPVTARDREAWYAARAAQGPSSGQMTGPPRAPGEPEPKRTTGARPPGFTDADFPRVKPPFVEDFVGRAAMITPEGELWVTRAAAFGEQVHMVDVFDASARLVRGVVLPAGRRVAGFGTGTVYLVRTDDDGLQWLERYAR